jgi:hypothetical protein
VFAFVRHRSSRNTVVIVGWLQLLSRTAALSIRPAVNIP